MKLARQLEVQAKSIAEAAVRLGWTRRRIRRAVERVLFSTISDVLRARVEREVGRRRNQ